LEFFWGVIFIGVGCLEVLLFALFVLLGDFDCEDKATGVDDV